MNKRKKEKSKINVVLQSPRYHLLNWLLLLGGVIAIALGFWFLWKGSVTLAPILMVLGYCIIIPLALILKIKKPASKEKADV